MDPGGTHIGVVAHALNQPHTLAGWSSFPDVPGDPIANLRSASGSLISVFIDRPSPGGFGALLSDLVRPLRNQAEGLGRAVEKSVRTDSGRIHDLADRLELEAAPAYAIFASELDSIFILEPLTYSIQSVSTLGPRPYMRPLRAAPRGLRAGVIVADRAEAKTFVSFAGIVDEVGVPLAVAIRKANYGGFSGYDEHTVRGHADEVSHRVWKEAGLRMLEEHQRRAFDYLAIGSHEETAEEIARSLHPYLARLHRTSFIASPVGIAPRDLRAEMSLLDVEVRHQRQEALAGRVCDTAWSGGNGVVGLGATLEAVNSQAVETLVVAGPYSRDGSVCNECGHLSRNETICRVCNSAMFSVDDVVGAVMDATVASGGSVFQIDVASPLDTGGIGALTRFPVLV